MAQAETPSLDSLLRDNPNSTLVTCGERVGLPAGQMGNSEVGHLNIGAGRVVEQWLLRISRALQGGILKESPEFNEFNSALAPEDDLHLIGLYSDGGVHSHSEHLKLLIKKLSEDGSRRIFLHLITDGRDTQPRCALQQVSDLLDYISQYSNVQIATVCGRFYAMDRDKRWERTEAAYRAIRHGRGHEFPTAQQAIAAAYSKDVSDEFIEPAVIVHAPIRANDGVIFWNFREDRMRQICSAICVGSFDGFARPEGAHPRRKTLCFTEYDHNFDLPFLFEILSIENHLGETISKQGLSQLRVAESEKYPHVTYFLNGGIEQPYPGEDRKLVPSPRDVKTYDLKPEMSAPQVTEIVVKALREAKYDLIVVNLANCDMVGHTGNMQAAVNAVETVDKCLGRMIKALEDVGGQGLVLADHGNAEQMVHYQDGTPHTAHTTYPVPIIMVGRFIRGRLAEGGALCDVAPTVLEMMGLEKPPEMTGKSLLIK